jgi:hypothetical protein
MEGTKVATEGIFSKSHIPCRPWRKLHNEELHSFFSSPSIIAMSMK